MTYDEFIKKNNGQSVEVSGPNSKYQCTDLANAYIRDVLNKPIIEYTNAEDFPAKMTSYGTWVANSKTNNPPKGAIVVWDFTTDDVGHIAIASGVGDSNHFESFDQNWPLKSKCHFVVHTYSGVVGWLIPNLPKGDNMPGKLINDSKGRVWNEFDGKYFYVENPASISGLPVENREPVGTLLIKQTDCPKTDCSTIQGALDNCGREKQELEETINNLKENEKEFEAIKNKLKLEISNLADDCQEEGGYLETCEIKLVAEDNQMVNKASISDLVRELLYRLVKRARKE